MPLDDLTCGQRDRTALLQQGVQTNQHTGLGNDCRLLDLDDVSVLEGLDEVGFHIGIGLTGRGLPFCRLGKLLDLLGDHVHDNSHAVPGSGILVGYAGKALKHTSRVKVHILQVGKIQKLCHIGIVDTAHTHEHFPLLVQVFIAGAHRVGFREDHTHEIKDFGGCRAGILHVRQMQTCRNSHGTLGFTGTGGTTHEEITHLHGSAGGDLRMTADVDHLIRDDVPFGKLGHQLLFQEGKLSSGSQLILALKIGMGDFRGSCSNSHAAGFGEDRELTRQNGVRRVCAGIQLCLGYPKHIAGFLDFCLNVRRTGFVFDPAVGVVTHDRHGFHGLIEVQVAVLTLRKINLEVVIELLILQKRWHHGHQNGGTVIGSLVQAVGFYHFGVLVEATGKDIAGDRVINHQMVGIRSCGRLVFGHHSVVNDADGTFADAGHAVT